MARNESENVNSLPFLEDEDRWVPRFLSIRENIYLERLPDSFIADRFNLYGFKEIIPNFEDSYSAIKGDKKSSNFASESKLYLLLHQRYVTFSKQGMQSVFEKIRSGDFGYCTRYGCNENFVVPTGMSNEFGKCQMKVFCHICQNIYEPKGSMKRADGCAWGTAFAQFLIVSNPYYFEKLPLKVFIPRLFGFRVLRDSSDEDDSDD